MQAGHQQHVTEGVVVDRRFHRSIFAVVAAHEPDLDEAGPGRHLGLEDGEALLGCRCEWLLAKYRLTDLDAGARELRVCLPRSGDQHRIDLSALDQLKRTLR